MNKHKLLGLAVVGGALAGAAYAADTSVTINIRKHIVPDGLNALFSPFKATATSGAASAGTFTFDLPVAPGKTSSDILEVLRNAHTVNGAPKPLNMVVSGTTMTVSNSNMTSGTIATGDVVRGMVIYKQ